MLRKVVGVTMSQIKAAQKHDQVSVCEGIKRYGQKAVEAVFSKYAQLEDKKISKPVHHNDLTKTDKSEALNLIIMIKQKRCGKIKGRACADGRKQRRYITKEESTSPTIQLESLLLTFLVDAKENRDVATADIGGAFLLADMEDFVLVKLRGESVDIMTNVNKEYSKYVTYESRREVLYLQLAKALYGCIMSSLLWYRTFTGYLETVGYTLNPYNPCVANKYVNGEQCTVCWYVDGTKISHEDPQVVTDLINDLEKRFGKMSVQRGKDHVFIGMNFSITDQNKIEIQMKEYIKESIESFEELGEKLESSATIPAKQNLFDIDDESEELDEEKAEIFHHIVSKLLYVTKKARLNINLSI